jgi:hypothetical protein
LVLVRFGGLGSKHKPPGTEWIIAHDRDREHSMMDILLLALAFGFFAAAIGYTYVCERL